MLYQTAIVNHLGNRNSNQDRFDIIETDEGVLLVLADGMGGMSAGEVAAQKLIDTARLHYQQSRRPVSKPAHFFTAIIHATHHALLRWAAGRQTDGIPGTTAVLCLIQEGRMDWAHVGDSRLYLVRRGLSVFRTTDHSYVEQLYRNGDIRRNEKDTHPRRNSITQCVGGTLHIPEVEVGKGKMLQTGDIVLLCSDGLWGALDDAQLGQMLRKPEKLDEALERMAIRAEQVSYPHSDNISALALQLTSLEPAPARPKVKPVPLVPPPEKKLPLAVDESKLQNAIAELEQAWELYKDELKQPDPSE